MIKAKHMSEKIKIVIVDSGVKLAHNIFKNANITSLEYRNGMLETIYNDNDTHGHGTAIAGIISHNTINADIIIIKAPDIENGLDEDTLIDILELIYYKDIIIVGSQSGTVPYDFGNISQYTIPQYELLMGASPDCVILCINPFDEIDYIKRTVNYIESIIDCKVIALVVFPMTLNNNWLGIYGNKRPLKPEEYELLRTKLTKQFQIPIFCLGCENDMALLSDKLIDFFADSTNE